MLLFFFCDIKRYVVFLKYLCIKVGTKKLLPLF